VRVSWRGATATAVVAVALPPVAQGPAGDWLQYDSLAGSPVQPWTPSVRRNSRGQTELYVTGYDVVNGSVKGALQRLVSDDGVRFRWDGIVLRPTDENCTMWGTGIENVEVARRPDGPGWRMFFAAGSNTCYGWQVFSAVSDDERSWRMEPGVRLDNGGAHPPTLSGNPYWGQGEGMVLHALPGGGWRMIVGGFERITPGEFRFQIVEWRSPDQLRWEYAGPVLTSRDMPPEANASVYSPTLREFAPGMFRMVFTGDNRNDPGARSRLWTAVSLDRQRWQVEGELLGAETTDLYYAALLDERLFFIRRDRADGRFRLAAATVRMP
jgi:hypothetical protein